jgi:predicted GNAT family N-acyltransferase
MSTFTLREASYPADLALLRAVREPVFVVEQQCPLDEEWDELDPVSRHVLALDEKGLPIGTGRLTPEHKIGRMAVLQQARGTGVGAAIMERLMHIATELGYASVSMHAQTHAIPFYARFGFHSEGPEFDEAGIPHRVMRARLDGRHSPLNRIILTRASDAMRTAIELARAAHHKLWIASADLEAAVYDNEAFVDAVKRVALSGRGASVQILVHDISMAMQSGHRLITLAQRISSLIEVRRAREHESGAFPGSIMLNDNGGWMRRPDRESYDGEAHLNDRPRQRELLHGFERAWERAEAETSARMLKL